MNKNISILGIPRSGTTILKSICAEISNFYNLNNVVSVTHAGHGAPQDNLINILIIRNIFHSINSLLNTPLRPSKNINKIGSNFTSDLIGIHDWTFCITQNLDIIDFIIIYEPYLPHQQLHLIEDIASIIFQIDHNDYKNKKINTLLNIDQIHKQTKNHDFDTWKDNHLFHGNHVTTHGNGSYKNLSIEMIEQTIVSEHKYINLHNSLLLNKNKNFIKTKGFIYKNVNSKVCQ